MRPWPVAAGLLLVISGAALSGSPAGADLQVGGAVPDLIRIDVGTPSAFAKVGGTTYELRVPVEVTSTTDETHLSIADGEDFKAPGRGHLRSGQQIAAAPLEVAAVPRPAQPLSAPVDPLLQTWFRALARSPVTIALRQSLPHGSIAGLHKVVLITVSAQTP